MDFLELNKLYFQEACVFPSSIDYQNFFLKNLDKKLNLVATMSIKQLQNL